MARFIADMPRKYLEVSTPSGTAHLGDAETGLEIHIRGWNAGVIIRCRAIGDNDEICVIKTGGSYSPSPKEEIIKLVQESPGEEG